MADSDANIPDAATARALLIERDRLQMCQLANCVSGVISTLGELNAIVGMESGENTDRHIRIKDQLFDLLAATMRVADYFSPPVPPE